MATDFIITKHHLPIIQFKAGDGSCYLQECRLGVPMTMDDLIRLAGDEAEIIGILEPGNLMNPYREITEEVAVAYLDGMAGTGELLKNMPLYVRNSAVGGAYNYEPSYLRPRQNGTYQVHAGRVA